MTVEITTDDGRRQLDVFDPIMRHRATLSFPESVDPAPVDVEFTFPVERIVEISTPEVVTDGETAHVFTDDGQREATFSPNTGGGTVDPGTYYISVNEAVKVYLRVETNSQITVTPSRESNSTTLEFGEEARVLVGARSTHQRPEATITTTDDPEDLMAAVSQFGSALKTTDPSRVYPTLRGHPPSLEFGDELSIPEELNAPDTGVTIQLPPERRYVYAAAPLAYYLSARVEPGEQARLLTDTGVDYAIDIGWGIEHGLNRLLQRIYTLDIMVKTDFAYSPPLQEREQFEAETGYDLDGLFEQSIADQLETYLDVDWADISPYSPEWPVSAHVAPTGSSIEYLPTLANELALVHPPKVTEIADSFEELSPPGGVGGLGGGLPPREVDPAELEEKVFRPERLDGTRQFWVGPGTPVGVEVPEMSAIQRSIDREPIDEGIDYVVVCNDERMAAEDEALRDLLTDNAGMSFDVKPYRNLTREELKTVLETEGDVFHFVGHTDDEGFECTDGKLPADAPESVAADVCFLNSCDSYEHGRRLVDGGAIAAVATLGEVDNSVATTVGTWTAGLINFGVPVGGAVELATDAYAETDRYGLVGNGSFRVVNPNGGGVDVVLEANDERVIHTTAPEAVPTLGVELQNEIDGEWYGAIPHVGYRCVHDREGYLEYLRNARDPIVLNGDLYWSDELPAEELYSTSDEPTRAPGATQ